jgi:hypothetical protein
LNSFVKQTMIDYGMSQSIVDWSDSLNTSIKELFPCKSGTHLDDEFAFLTRHGSLSSYKEFRSMERERINSIIARIQEQQKEEAEAQKEAMKEDNGKGGIRS